MGINSGSLEGVVVIVLDAWDSARLIDKALSRAGAAVFLADGDDSSRGSSYPQNLALRFFSHPVCRTMVYSSHVDARPHVDTKPLVRKNRSVSDVVEAVLFALNDPSWLAKRGDEVKPVL